MVLQNRHALNMVIVSQFMSSAMLGKECCFYVNKFGWNTKQHKSDTGKDQRPKGKSCKGMSLLGRNLFVSLPWTLACNTPILLISPYLVNCLSRIISPRWQAVRFQMLDPMNLTWLENASATHVSWFQVQIRDKDPLKVGLTAPYKHG
jgi:hypothetical protein